MENPSTAKAFETIEQILEIIEPTKTVTIVDIYGNETSHKTKLPIRKQRQILKRTTELVSLVTGSFDPKKGIAAVMAEVVANDKVVDDLCELFVIAYPRAFRKAAEAARADGESGAEIQDLFAIEDIVESLVPLYGRLAQPIRAMMTKHQTQKKQQEA